ncbi:MAG: ComF family protein [Flavobacteriales bacterium]|nr:ComF family protein [Flavobacteriales bacterium]
MIQYLIDLIYPNICVACNKNLSTNEKQICSRCYLKLPYTRFAEEKDNAIEKIFWGRVPIEAAMALFYFNKGNRVQSILHQLKYKGNFEIGIDMGILAGNELKTSVRFADLNLITAVPLHSQKKKQRGYNQSEMFAKGIAKATCISTDFSVIERTIYTQTQTQKSRLERLNNVEKAFFIPNPEKIKNKHILLVDDVITTGATLEACAACLQKVNGVKISIAAIACA